MTVAPRRTLCAAILAIAALGAAPFAAAGEETPWAQAAVTCSAYSTQAEAQRAADTRDADSDGIYCESLPCPCSSGDAEAESRPAPVPPPRNTDCARPKTVQRISFSKTKYPHIRQHYLSATRHGWPRILVLNRQGAEARRARLLANYETRGGYDRDEYPPAVGRGRGKGLVKGTSPRGWRADVEYVESSENRSHGSRMGIKLRRFCDGTRFKYVFY